MTQFTKEKLLEAFDEPSTPYQLSACIAYIRQLYADTDNKGEFTINLRDTLLIDNL